MRFSDILRMCFENLKRRKGRTFLTVLGVFIGCVSIIVMVSIGVGMKESNDKTLAEMGDLTIIEVSSQGGKNINGKTVKLNDEALKTISAIPNVTAVMPKTSLDEFSIKMTAGINDRYKCEWSTLVGVDLKDMQSMGYTVLDGKIPQGGGYTVVGGQFFAYAFTDSFMPEGRNQIDRWSNMSEDGKSENLPDPYFNPLNTPIMLHITKDAEDKNELTQELKIGAIVKEDYSKGYETSEGILMDIKDMKALIAKVKEIPVNNIEYSTFLVKTDHINSVQEVEKQIKELGYGTYSMESIRKSMEKSSRQIQMLLGGLGAISLFVAAIGITNTMIMSISERTKEIGIMKALGCYVKDIRLLFLMEAGSIGLIGGVVGCFVSILASIGTNLFSMGAFSPEGTFTLSMIKDALFGGKDITRLSVIPIELIVFGILFSVLVGLVSGYYPANKAVKITALEAIKSD